MMLPVTGPMSTLVAEGLSLRSDDGTRKLAQVL